MTPAGKFQARLMVTIGQAWYNHHGEMPDIPTFLEKITAKNRLHPFVKRALALGKKLKTEKNNMLVNHHILKREWHKFRDPYTEAPKIGVYKLLSDKYRK